MDLLQPVAMTTIHVRMPADDRARQVADGIAADPADGRTLAEWGHDVGASERTLARAFLADTGMSFGRWRTLLRVQAALAALARGEPVGNVARHVGYDSDSAFVQAFRRETGVTPAAYFRQALTGTRSGLAQEPERALLLEVQRPRRWRLDPADPSPELGDLRPDPRIGEHPDAEGERDRADVVAPLQRQAKRDGREVGVGELPVRARRARAGCVCHGPAWPAVRQADGSPAADLTQRRQQAE